MNCGKCIALGAFVGAATAYVVPRTVAALRRIGDGAPAGSAFEGAFTQFGVTSSVTVEGVGSDSGPVTLPLRYAAPIVAGALGGAAMVAMVPRSSEWTSFGVSVAGSLAAYWLTSTIAKSEIA